MMDHTSEGSDGSERIVSVLVDRFLRSKQWTSYKFVLWFCISSNEEPEPTFLQVTPSTSHADLLTKTKEVPSEMMANNNIIGTLETGEKLSLIHISEPTRPY